MKKIFLTESQINYILRENQILNESFLRNMYANCKTFQDYYEATLKLLSIGLITTATALVLMTKVFPNEATKHEKEMKIAFEKAEKEKAVSFENERKKLKKQKIEEINNLMCYVCELNGRDPETLELSAEHIVNMCEKYNFPLPLLLAQAHLESHFGTTNRAKRTNSVFSVGSYDDGRNVYKPSTQNESIENYIQTIQRYYLQDKSVDELLKNGGFVNYLGKRYASDKHYELKIRQTMNGLIKQHCPSCF